MKPETRLLIESFRLITRNIHQGGKIWMNQAIQKRVKWLFREYGITRKEIIEDLKWDFERRNMHRRHDPNKSCLETYVLTFCYYGVLSMVKKCKKYLGGKSSIPQAQNKHGEKINGRSGDRPKTKKSKRYVDCIAPVLEALEEQRQWTGNSQHIFLTQGEARMNPDHYRNVVWTKALDKAGLEYRPPIQTRHTFATLMLSAGEDIGWVQSMMGHSSLQMIFTRYYAWIPRKTRNDGSAFMQSIGPKDPEKSDRKEAVTGAKVIALFPKVSQLRHTQIKKESGETP